MTLSNSRHQFLPYESQAHEDVTFRNKHGLFISKCVCASFIFLALVFAVVVGVIVYFITASKIPQHPENFWDETEPFGLPKDISNNLRLSNDVEPNFYRLKLKTNLENSSFTGDVHITIRIKKKIKEIILHAKDLTISNNIKLTEQKYEKVETIHSLKRSKRDAKVQTDNLEKNTSESTNVTSNPNDLDAITTTTEGNNINANSTFNEFSTNKEINGTTDSGIKVSTEKTVIDNRFAEVSTTKTESTVIQTTNEELTSVPPALTTNIPLPEKDIENSINISKEHSEDSSTNIQKIPSNEDKFNTKNTQVTHSKARVIKISSITLDKSSDRLILSLSSELQPNLDYILELTFNGTITNALTGFYKSSYRDSNNQIREMGVTQFEPISARAAFPCFDEPKFKAKFEISIAHSDKYTVLSNMKMSTQEKIDNEPGWLWTHFERSVKMSTYLVAYIISDFQAAQTSYISKENTSKEIRIWARPQLLNKTRYALSIVPKLLAFYEEIFGMPYTLDKLDLIAIPDFSSGAMENWGLITFKETSLLYDDIEGDPSDKQNVAASISHELAHQWFGNVVTMSWWTDLWLNEGFATYMEYVGVDHIEPGWNTYNIFIRDMMNLYRTDALKNTSPVSREVTDASDISQKFDAISYTKGACLIRMLNNTISQRLFHKGLAYYLNKWQYNNAEENNLWEAMSEVTKNEPALNNISLVKFMNSWTRQAGYPVVNVVRNYNLREVTFSQSLFSSASEPHAKMVNQLWQIPISYETVNSTSSNWFDKSNLWLINSSFTKDVAVKDDQALYVNVDAIGYFRVNYDLRNWELLDKALKKDGVLSPIAKAQLIDDSFNLAQTSKLDYAYPLSLSTYIINGEDSKLVWDILINNLEFLNFNLKTLPFYNYYQDYIQKLINKQLVKMKYGLSKPKDDNEALLVGDLVALECFVESKRCIEWAHKEFNTWMSEPNIINNPIPSYLRDVVYHTVLKHGGRNEFEFLWKVYNTTVDPNIKSIVIRNLANTRDEALLVLMLERSLSEIPSQYAAEVWDVESPSMIKIVQEYLVRNWDKVYKKMTQLDPFMFSSILNGAFGFISSEYELNKFKTFALQRKEELRPMSQTVQKLVDTANFRIDWLQKQTPSIEKWLKEYSAASKNTIDTTTNTPLTNTSRKR